MTHFSDKVDKSSYPVDFVRQQLVPKDIGSALSSQVRNINKCSKGQVRLIRIKGIYKNTSMESQPCSRFNLILLVPMGQPMTEVWEIESAN